MLSSLVLCALKGVKAGWTQSQYVCRGSVCSGLLCGHYLQWLALTCNHWVNSGPWNRWLFPPRCIICIMLPTFVVLGESGCVGLLGLGYINILWGSACFLYCLAFPIQLYSFKTRKVFHAKVFHFIYSCPAPKSCVFDIFMKILWGSACFYLLLTFKISVSPPLPERCFVLWFFIWYVRVLLPNGVFLYLFICRACTVWYDLTERGVLLPRFIDLLHPAVRNGPFP